MIWAVHKWWTRKDFESVSCGLFKGAILMFAWKGRVKPRSLQRNSPIQIAAVTPTSSANKMILNRMWNVNWTSRSQKAGYYDEPSGIITSGKQRRELSTAQTRSYHAVNQLIMIHRLLTVFLRLHRCFLTIGHDLFACNSPKVARDTWVSLRAIKRVYL